MVSSPPLRVVGYLIKWFEPVSSDPAVVFRERAIRAFTAAVLFVGVLGLVTSFMFYGGSYKATVAYPVLIGIVCIVLLGSAISVARGKVERAARLLVAAFVIGTWGTLFVDEYRNGVGVPGGMLVLLLAGLVLSRRAIWYMLAILLVLLIAIVLYQDNQATTGQVRETSTAGIMTNYVGYLSVTAFTLYQFRKDFDTRLEIAEAARRQAERADSLKGQFVANISHEFRTPLSAIIGFATLLYGDMAGEPAEQKKLIQAIGENSKELLGLIDQVLDLAKIEAGQARPALTYEHPLDLVQSSVDALSSLFKEKNLAVEVVSDKETPGTVLCDSAKVKKVVTNLLGNAVKFTNEGQVTVHVGSRSKKTWYFAVADTGIGISANALRYIFDPFRQVETDSYSRKYGGTGLGLALVKRYLDVIGGEIVVESAPGKGSTFTVTLPQRIQVSDLSVEMGERV